VRAAVSHNSWQSAHGAALGTMAPSTAIVSARRCLLALLCLVVSACGGANTPQGSGGRTLVVFAAASLSRAMPLVGKGFDPQVHVDGDYEGTQSLLSKLEADPTLADVFVSADRRHMDQAVARGLVDQPRDIALNTLVIAVPPGNPRHIGSLADLARPGVRISLADTSVPAGSYAEQSFELAESNHDAPAGFAQAVLKNVVTRQTQVETVVSDVAAGAVDAGIVYATDAQGNGHIEAVLVPQRDQPSTVYVAAAVRRGRNHADAQRFVDHLLTPPAQAVLLRFGFSLPGPTAQPLGGAAPRTP
jgi:molybdate transport system substrate-binding protein